MFSKRIIIFLIIVLSLAIISAIVFNMVSARRGSAQVDRTRYMSDILRITDGVTPVLWIDPKYSYESAAKYFDLSGNGNHGIQNDANKQPQVKPPGLYFDGTGDYLNCYDNQTQILTRKFINAKKTSDTCLTEIPNPKSQTPNNAFKLLALGVCLSVGTWPLKFNRLINFFYHKKERSNKNMNFKKQNKEKSFMLIELLVVIALIGLIATVALAVLGNTKEKARIAKSLRFSQSIQNTLNPAAIWSFDENKKGTCPGGKDICDFAGNNHCKIVGGVSWTDDTPHKIIGKGKHRYALDFDGATGYLNCYDEKTQALTKNQKSNISAYGGSAEGGKNQNYNSKIKNGIIPNCSEILSQEGYCQKNNKIYLQQWKYFKEITKDDEILTLNPETREQEWHKPYRFIAYPYKGRMLHIKSKVKSQKSKVDLLVTPDHQMFASILNCHSEAAAEESRHYSNSSGFFTPLRSVQNDSWSDFQLILAEEIYEKEIQLLVSNDVILSDSEESRISRDPSLLSVAQGDKARVAQGDIVEISPDEMEWVDYNGMVYDVTVENHILLVRRNLTNQKAISNEMASGRPTDLPIGTFDKLIYSIAHPIILSSPSAVDNLMAVEVGEVESPRRSLSNVPDKPATPTANLLYHNNNENKNSTPVWSGNCGNDPSLNITDAITIEAWVKLNILSGVLTILSKANPGPTNYWMDIRTSGTEIYVGGYTSASGACYNPASVSLETNIWYHLAWTYDRERMITYLDGVSVSNVSKTCVLNANDAPLRIGTRSGSDGMFNGTIDEVRIYNRALSASQIQQSYLVSLPRHQE